MQPISNDVLLCATVGILGAIAGALLMWAERRGRKHDDDATDD